MITTDYPSPIEYLQIVLAKRYASGLAGDVQRIFGGDGYFITDTALICLHVVIRTNQLLVYLITAFKFSMDNESYSSLHPVRDPTLLFVQYWGQPK